MEGHLQDLDVEHLVLRYILRQDKKDGTHRQGTEVVIILKEMEGKDDYLKSFQTGEGDGVILLTCTCICWEMVDSTIAYIVGAEYTCSRCADNHIIVTSSDFWKFRCSSKLFELDDPSQTV